MDIHKDIFLLYHTHLNKELDYKGLLAIFASISVTAATRRRVNQAATTVIHTDILPTVHTSEILKQVDTDILPHRSYI